LRSSSAARSRRRASRTAAFAIEADLASAKVDNLLPGLDQAAEQGARGLHHDDRKGANTRIDDIAIDGGGVSVRDRSNSTAIATSWRRIFRRSECRDDKESLKVEPWRTGR